MINYYLAVFALGLFSIITIFSVAALDAWTDMLRAKTKLYLLHCRRMNRRK